MRDAVVFALCYEWIITESAGIIIVRESRPKAGTSRMEMLICDWCSGS